MKESPRNCANGKCNSPYWNKTRVRYAGAVGFKQDIWLAIEPEHMDAENRTDTMEIITHSDKCVNCTFVVIDKVRKLLGDASANHDMTDVLLPLTLNKYKKWRAIHPPHTLGNMPAEKQALLYCDHYLSMVEAWYTPIVDRVCYMLMWRTNPPTLDCLKGRWYNKVDADILNNLKHVVLSNKVKYLKKNEFEYLADACNVKLRNDIAHRTIAIDVSAPDFVTDIQTPFSIMQGMNIRLEDGTYVDVIDAYIRLEHEVTKYSAAF